MSETQSRRALWLFGGLAILVLLLAGGLLVGRPALERLQRQQRLAGLSGRLLLPTDSGLVEFDLATGGQRPIIPTPTGQVVSAGAWSPDGTQVVYSLFHRRPDDPASVVEIFLARADGSESRVLAERDAPGAVLDLPVWSPDGRRVYFSYFGQSGGRSVQRIERVELATGQRSVVADNAYAPAISPDGAQLAFLRDDRSGSGLYLAALDGSNVRPLLPPGKYPPLAVPRFSPDGQRVAVAIVNDLRSEAPRSDPLAWLVPPVAYAHGLPWDIWTFDLQGEDAVRVSNVAADDPSPAWSPNGQHIAFWSGSGLFVAPSTGGNTVKLLDDGGYGALDWGP